jgi:hypothetical protein
VYGLNIQGGAFVSDDLELFGAWCWSDTIDVENFLQIGANWYFAKNNVKMTVMGIIPMNSGATSANNLRGYEGGIGLGTDDTAGLTGADNNFSLVCQLQVMF